jgi:hypothetical protein
MGESTLPRFSTRLADRVLPAEDGRRMLDTCLCGKLPKAARQPA